MIETVRLVEKKVRWRWNEMIEKRSTSKIYTWDIEYESENERQI